MEINWGIFLASIILLLYPIDRLLPDYMKCRTGDALADPAVRHRRKWWLWQPELGLDALRVAIGTWFLNFASQAQSAKTQWTVTLVVGLILAVGICCQMPTRREDDFDSALASVSFLLGAMLALVPVTAALAVFMLAMSALLAFRSFAAFFLTGAVLTSGLTYLLGGDFPTGLMLAVIHLVPLLASLMMERGLVLPVRNPMENEKARVKLR